jgi:putative oxidoreductase
MDRDYKLELSLVLMRLTTAAFMLVWAVAKFANVKQQQGVAAAFYGWKDAAPEVLMAIGIAQVVLLLAFAAGLYKTWTYGAVFLMHAASVAVGIGKMIPPYGPGAAMTFWAGVPVLAGLAALWLLRDRDRMVFIS